MYRMTEESLPANHSGELLTPNQNVVVRLDRSPVMLVNEEPVQFVTRHAEQTFRLLASISPDGIDAKELSMYLWPDVAVERRSPRLRTLLWQIRKSIGEGPPKLRRSLGVVSLDVRGVHIQGEYSMEQFIRYFEKDAY